MYVRLDTTQMIYTKQTYGLSTLLAESVGIFGSLKFVFMAAAIFISKPMFMEDIVENLFMSKKSKNLKPKPDCPPNQL